PQGSIESVGRKRIVSTSAWCVLFLVTGSRPWQSIRVHPYPPTDGIRVRERNLRNRWRAQGIVACCWGSVCCSALASGVIPASWPECRGGDDLRYVLREGIPLRSSPVRSAKQP